MSTEQTPNREELIRDANEALEQLREDVRNIEAPVSGHMMSQWPMKKPKKSLMENLR